MATRNTIAVTWPQGAPRRRYDRAMPKGRAKFGSYGKHFLGGLGVAALGSLYGDQFIKSRPDLTGYVLALSCGIPGPRWGIPGNCGTFPAVKPGPGPVSGRPLNVSNWVYVGPRNSQQDDWGHQERWTRVVGAGRPLITTQPMPTATPDYPAMPGIDLPGRWAGLPQNIPYATLPRLRNNLWPQWRAAYSSVHQYQTEKGRTPPGSETGGFGIPGRAQIPAWVIDVRQPALPGVRPGPTLSTYDGVHVLARPKPPEKEIKVKTLDSKGARFIRFALNAVTEGKDFVDALYSALPVAYKIRRSFSDTNEFGPYAKPFLAGKNEDGTYRRGAVRYTNAAGYEIEPKDGRSFASDNLHKQYIKPLSPQEKAQAIWRYRDKMDAKYIARALDAVFANQREDRLFGMLGKVTGRASRKRGFGIARGLAL